MRASCGETGFELVQQVDPPERRYASRAATELLAASGDAAGLGAAMAVLTASGDVDDVVLAGAARLAVRQAESAHALRVLLVGLAPLLAPQFGGDASRSLGALVEARDRGVAAHHDGAEAAAGRLALYLGLDQSAVTRVECAARVFDVGKLFLPPEILYDERPLDRETWPVVKAHAVDSWTVVAAIPSLAPLAGIVRAHHERPDGHGYPDALAGGAIPLEARILSLVDAWVSIVSARPFRPAFTVREAILMLEDGRGMQWDSEIVDAQLAFVAARRLKHDAAPASAALAPAGTSNLRRTKPA
jgi:HD-GYP domain-containing protein (c-di-GMP phosphodiesterase class II)